MSAVIELDATFAETTENFPCAFEGDQAFSAQMDGVLPGDYNGTYEVTPSSEQQTLATAGRTLQFDVVVRPVPSNYGLVTYNGSTITIS